MRPVGQYKSKPFDCWDKCKELRVRLFESVMATREQGKLLATGSVVAPTEVLAGFGEFEHLGGEPYGALLGNYQEFAQECYEAYEAKGFARDHCAYLRAYMGSVFLNRSPWGEFPKPDFALTCHICDSHGKWYQMLAEHLGVPVYAVDIPQGKEGSPVEARLEYLVAQFHDLVEWLEKLTGRKCDDEKVIEAVYNSGRVRDTWTDICELNQAIPAPMDLKSMCTFYMPAVHMRHKKEAVDFYRALYDEMKDRVANSIAAVATERCRLLHENIPPWFGLHIFRFMEKYGVVAPAGLYCFSFGSFQPFPDGHWGRPPTLEERGVVLRTREDAFRVLAERWAGRENSGITCHGKASAVVDIARRWKCDGAIFHLNRSCEGRAIGDMEGKLAIQKELGIPAMVYEGNSGDRREWNDAEVLDRIQTFLEGTMGLERLVD